MGHFPLPFARSYDTLRTGKSNLSALPVTVDGLALLTGAASLPPIFGKGACLMVTYSELFAYSLVIIGICGLFIQVHKKK